MCDALLIPMRDLAGFFASSDSLSACEREKECVCVCVYVFVYVCVCASNDWLGVYTSVT